MYQNLDRNGKDKMKVAQDSSVAEVSGLPNEVLEILAMKSPLWKPGIAE